MIDTNSTVIWTSQAASYTTTKTGIAYKVPAGQDAWEVAKSLFDMRKLQLRFDTYTRNHDSFLVLVDLGPKKQKALYWPRVSALKKVAV